MESRTSSCASRVHIRALARVDELHREISSGRWPSSRALAQKLERSEKTVKRALQEMRERLGAPLYYNPTHRGWGYSEPGWSPPPIHFNESELLAFFTAEQTLRAAGLTPEAMLLKASLAKLATYLPESVTANLHTLSEALTFQQLPHAVVNPLTLQTLARAAAERRTISFDYHSQHRNERNHRKADVLALHNFAGDWYAIAFDHWRDKVLDFHAARMSNLRETDHYFDLPDDWDRDAYLRKGFFMMRGGRRIKVQIVFDAYQARWMRERDKFHPDEQREELPGGELRLTFSVGRNGLDAVARFCLAYAGHCRVERPAALRKLIRDRLTRALKQHRED